MVRTAFIFLLTAFLSSLAMAENEPQVQVENPFYIVKEKGKTKIKTDPYRDRRSNWGIRTEFGTSFYDPVEKMVEESGTSIYFSFGFNRNFRLFSVGPEFSVLSTSVNTGVVDDVDALVLMVGGNIYLDGLFDTPYVVPFAGFGVANFDISEDAVSDSETNKSPSTYYKAGVLVQLNWLDKFSAARGYYNYGLENTFVVLQIRNISKTDDEPLINLGTSMTFELGIQLEF